MLIEGIVAGAVFLAWVILVGWVLVTLLGIRQEVAGAREAAILLGVAAEQIRRELEDLRVVAEAIRVVVMTNRIDQAMAVATRTTTIPDLPASTEAAAKAAESHADGP